MKVKITTMEGKIELKDFISIEITGTDENVVISYIDADTKEQKTLTLYAGQITIV